MMSRNKLCSILTISRTHLTAYTRSIRRFHLRKLALLAPVFAFLCIAHLASAQQGDVMFGGGTLLSSGSGCNINTGCPEKGGFYPSISADVIFKKRVGFN